MSDMELINSLFIVSANFRWMMAKRKIQKRQTINLLQREVRQWSHKDACSVHKDSPCSLLRSCSSLLLHGRWNASWFLSKAVCSDFKKVPNILKQNSGLSCVTHRLLNIWTWQNSTEKVILPNWVSFWGKCPQPYHHDLHCLGTWTLSIGSCFKLAYLDSLPAI